MLRSKFSLLISGAGNTSVPPSLITDYTRARRNRNSHIRVEIPIRSYETKNTSPESIPENKIKVGKNIVLGLRKPSTSLQETSYAAALQMSDVDSSKHVSRSGHSEGSAQLQLNQQLHETKGPDHVPTSPESPYRPSTIASVPRYLNKNKNLTSGNSREERLQPKAVNHIQSTSADELDATSPFSSKGSALVKSSNILTNDEDGDDEGGRRLLSRSHIPKPRRSGYHNVYPSRRVIHALSAYNSSNKNNVE